MSEFDNKYDQFTFYCSSIKSLVLSAKNSLSSPYLHSTVVLLKGKLKGMQESFGKIFTFYCSSIKSSGLNGGWGTYGNLHSTVVLLKV